MVVQLRAAWEPGFLPRGFRCVLLRAGCIRGPQDFGRWGGLARGSVGGGGRREGADLTGASVQGARVAQRNYAVQFVPPIRDQHPDIQVSRLS